MSNTPEFDKLKHPTKDGYDLSKLPRAGRSSSGESDERAAVPADLHEFKVRLSEYGVAMYHGQGEKACVLSEVLESMFEGAALATQPAPAEPVSVLDVDAYVAERIAAEGEQFLGEVAYQLTKRLVIDMPTARAAVDAAFKYVATALAATAPNLVANILKDCCECERPNHWDVETVELRVSDLTMILQRHIEGKE